MSRRTIIHAILACLLVAYIVIILPVANRAQQNDGIKNIEIRIDDPDNTGFVTKADVNEIVNDYKSRVKSLKRKDINTFQLTRQLNECNRIERSKCTIMSDGRLVIDIDPMQPVARFFDPEGSVYVNTAGKRVPALPQYHVDVPVVTSETTADSALVAKLLPVLREIKVNPRMDALVASLHIDRRGDVIIIPNIVGHVINFGDTTLIKNKLVRLHTFYDKVMPAKGWNAYDTISVKWAGRIVATKRDKTTPNKIGLDNLEDIIDETLDDDVMLTDAL